MDGLVFFFVSMVALLAFMAWERRRAKTTSGKPLDRSSIEHGFLPGASSRETAMFIAAGGAAIFGLMFVFQPIHPPFDGRGALVNTLLYVWFGPWGLPIACWSLAALVFSIAFGVRRRRLESEHRR